MDASSPAAVRTRTSAPIPLDTTRAAQQGKQRASERRQLAWVDGDRVRALITKAHDSGRAIGYRSGWYRGVQVRLVLLVCTLLAGMFAGGVIVAAAIRLGAQS